MQNANSRVGFVFDLDGTLINSTDIGKIIERKIYEKFNIQQDAKFEKEKDELIYKIVQGENRKNLGKEVMLAIFKKLGLSFFQRVQALLYSGKIFKEENKKVKLFNGVQELFEFLDANSYPYAIATTSSKKEIDDRLKKFPDFYRKLDGKIITRDSVKNLKPHPESIEKASKIMGVSLNHCVMVGDMHSDINMGKAVNAITVGVLTGIFTKEKFLEYEPDFIIDSVANIPMIIGRINEKARSYNSQKCKS
jgi:HAD superfamily hydrolase (TIGR01549 family)